MAFPIEIYCAIIGQVAEQRDLCSVARCSTILQLEAERILYRCITLKKPGDFLTPIRSIISHPRRHHLVQVLDIHVVPARWGSGSYLCQSAISRLMARLLRVTKHLKALKLRNLPGWILHYANYPLLKYFDFDFARMVPLAPCGHSFIIKFLEQHPFIEQLSLTRPAIHGLQIPLLPFLHTLNLFASVIEAMPAILRLGSTLMVLDLTACHAFIQEQQAIEKTVSGLPLLRYLGLPAHRYTRIEPYHSWIYDLVRSVRTHLKMLIIIRLDFKASIDEVPDLFQVCESLKWLISSTMLSSQCKVHTRDNPPKVLTDEMELQRILLDLGIKVTRIALKLTCFPTSNV